MSWLYNPSTKQQALSENILQQGRAASETLVATDDNSVMLHSLQIPILLLSDEEFQVSEESI